MKNIIITLSALIFLTTTGFNNKTITSGNTACQLGSYIIVKSDRPLISDADILRTYDVKYANSDMDVRIAIDDRDRKCLSFIVVSGDFGIQYNCDKKILGVSTVAANYVEDGIPGTNENLNRAEYFRQKVLTRGSEDETEIMRLIAVYFPKLMITEPLYATK
ncbi:MAG: hypothetical protein LC649_04595 [Bacteroidales bacterium]|nr:hypothetical protein [Bacteroidales bacterium]